MNCRNAIKQSVLFYLFCAQFLWCAPDVPVFSVKHGFFQAPFQVVVSSPTPGAVIKYTFDGSEPQTSSSALSRISPVTITIDPESTAANRPIAAGVVLRACTVVSDSIYSASVTQTYLFTAKVKELSPQGQLPGPINYEQQLGAIKGMATQDPKRVAQVVKNWVSSDG